MWCKSDSYKTFIIDTFAHFAQKKIYRPLFEKTDFVALIRPHRVHFPSGEEKAAISIRVDTSILGQKL